MRSVILSMFAVLAAGGALAQESSLNDASSMTTTTTTSSSSTNNGLDTSGQAQRAAIQSQITQGISNGTLSEQQIERLQAQQDRLSNGQALVGTNPGGAVNGPLFNQTGPSANSGRTATGPDPFTYNSLGPDAYQAQKNQNPQYTVPAYPTTNSTSLNTTQQYNTGTATGPASVTPQVGTYYGNNGVSGGNVATVTPSGGGNGVYVYQPGMSRR